MEHQFKSKRRKSVGKVPSLFLDRFFEEAMIDKEIQWFRLFHLRRGADITEPGKEMLFTSPLFELRAFPEHVVSDDSSESLTLGDFMTQQASLRAETEGIASPKGSVAARPLVGIPDRAALWPTDLTSAASS